MIKTRYSLVIKKMPAQVFTYLNNTDHLKKWLSGLVDIEALTEGGNRVGAKTKQRYQENGREFEMFEEILIYEPNQRVKIKGNADFFSLQAEYRLSEVPEGTRLDFESSTRFHSFFLRLLSPLMAGAAKKRIKADLGRLKNLVEESSSVIISSSKRVK